MKAATAKRVISIAVASCATVGVVLALAVGVSPADSPAPPLAGVREQLSLVSGSVSVRIAGSSRFVSLTGTITVPDASEVDATGGRVSITVAVPPPALTATALAYSGRFVLRQDLAAPNEAHLSLSGATPSCHDHAPGAKKRVAGAARTRHRPAASRQLWVSDGGGHWGTSGRYVSTTVEGTRWLTADSCRQSSVKVAEGTVLVRDLIHGTSVSVSAGHSYVASRPLERAGFVPSLGSVLSGETGVAPGAFAQQVGKHASLFGFFGSWGGEFAPLLNYVSDLRARLLLHLSTDVGYGSSAGQEISPGQIAQGLGDDYLVRLCTELSRSTAPVYVALLPEMNQTNNAYSAFNANGSPRGRSNSTSAFKQAWRRSVLIVRGGLVASINHRLRALGLPPLSVSSSTLPRPQVSFMWAPQTAGTPDTPANSAAAYYPGGAYVDVVGTDFYSAFPNFRGLSALYAAYPTKPFGFNEWAMWKSGDPSFVRQLFAFVRTHRRVALMAYNEGLTTNGPFRLTRFPAARRAIRTELRPPRFLAYPPE